MTMPPSRGAGGMAIAPDKNRRADRASKSSALVTSNALIRALDFFCRALAPWAHDDHRDHHDVFESVSQSVSQLVQVIVDRMFTYPLNPFELVLHGLGTSHVILIFKAQS